MTNQPTPRIPNWQPFITRWGREPVRASLVAPGQPPIDPQRSFEVVRLASRPFRAGTRAQALPDVGFYTDGGQLRAPATRLPGPEDSDLPSYLGRLQSQFGEAAWLLTVESPLSVDFDLWSAVRDLLSQLWQQVGWPTLPVKAELAIGQHYTRTRNLLPTTAAGLLWVLAGTVTVRLFRGGGATEPYLGHPDVELGGWVGDLLYWPADFRACEVLGDGCMTLRAEIASEYRKAMAVVKNALADMAQRTPTYANGRPLHLPYQPPVAADGSVPVASNPDAEVDTLLRRLTYSPDLARTLRHDWAARRSAAGLEPVPPPLPASALDYGHRVRAVAEIVRMPDGPDRSIWAANGHVLPIAGNAAERIRATLMAEGEVGVAQLGRTVGASHRHASVLKLMRLLHRIRAVRPTTEPPGGRQDGD